MFLLAESWIHTFTCKIVVNFIGVGKEVVVVLLVWYLLHFDTDKTHIILNILKIYLAN
jgi:hypothetical protein